MAISGLVRHQKQVISPGWTVGRSWHRPEQGRGPSGDTWTVACLLRHADGRATCEEHLVESLFGPGSWTPGTGDTGHCTLSAIERLRLPLRAVSDYF